MSKKKDRERAEKGGIIRHEGDERDKGICVVPGCNRTFFIEEGKLPLCPDCMAFLNKLTFFLPRIKQGQTPSGLVLPGQPEYTIPEDVLRSEIERRLKP